MSRIRFYRTDGLLRKKGLATSLIDISFVAKIAVDRKCGDGVVAGR